MEELVLRKSKVVRLMKIQFGGEVTTKDIPAFRGAIIEKVGRSNVLFHHHLEENRVLYKYPLIQYKSIYKSPVIVCLNDGVDDIHHLFQFNEESINLKGSKFNLEISKVDIRKIKLQTWSSKIGYRITNWLPLNQVNYRKFLGFKDEDERRRFLEKILTGNILSFAKGIDWTIEDQLKVDITGLKGPYALIFKGEKWLAFSAKFSTNVSLPQFIGLGKGVSHGFGVVGFSNNSRNRNE